MNVYNCLNQNENPIPYWMIDRPPASKAEESAEKAEPQSKKNLPVFTYTTDSIFPDFCQVKRK